MADVKWIKICTDIFDDEKITLIESMPDADGIIVIWFKLLCLAGKQNNGGIFMMNDKLAYTDEMLATIFRRSVNTVRLALNVFEQFGMVEIVNNVVTIPNWEKHQSLDAYERKKAYDRERIARIRAENKSNIEQNSFMSYDKKRHVANCRTIEEDKEEDIEKDKDKEGDKKEKCQKIIDIFNSLCPSFPKVKFLSDSMISNISNLVERFPESDISTAFQKCEKSSFLKGKNPRKWKASFDWIIKPQNLTKILNGNYDDEITSDASYDLSEFRRKSLNEPLKYERNRKK